MADTAKFLPRKTFFFGATPAINNDRSLNTLGSGTMTKYARGPNSRGESKSASDSGYGLPGPYSLADLDRGVHFERGPNLLGHRCRMI